MDLSFSDTQQALAESAHAFLDRNAPFERIRKLESSETGSDDELWSAMVVNGWMEVPFSDRSEIDLSHLGVLLRELGGSACVSPFFQSVAAAGVTVHRLGDTEQAGRLVSRISQGQRSALVAPAHPARLARGVRVGAALQISGGPFNVEWAHLAESLVCPVQLDDNSFTLLVIDPRARGLDIQTELSIDHERVGRVTLDGVVADDGQRLTSAPRPLTELGDALALVRLLRAAEMTGGIRQSLDLTVAHITTRQQFGRLIGSFQAVQHTCADMLTEYDCANLSVWEALTRAETGLAFVRHAAVAAFFAGRAYERVTRHAAQLHGGIGFMSEYPLQYHFRRAKAQRLRLGTTQLQLENVARQVIDPIVDSAVSTTLLTACDAGS